MFYPGHYLDIEKLMTERQDIPVVFAE